MAFNQTTAIIVVAAALLAAAAMGESPSPSPLGAAGAAPGPTSLDCTTYLVNMSDCLSYVEAGSNATAPEKGCCPELAGLVESHPICLCQLLGNANSFGIQISVSRALKLPSACGVSTPPLSTCSAVGYPVGVPMPSEAPSSSPGGAAAGSPESGKSGVSSIRILSLWSFLVGFVMIIYLTTFF